MAIGSSPRYLEELAIGGGFGEAVDGGADFEKNGDISTDGSVTLKGVLSVGATPHVLTNAAGLIDGAKLQDATVDTAALTDDSVTPSKLDESGDFVMNTLELGANTIMNSQGETTVTFDVNQNATVEGDVYLNGGGNIGTDTDSDLVELSDNTVNLNGTVNIDENAVWNREKYAAQGSYARIGEWYGGYFHLANNAIRTEGASGQWNYVSTGAWGGQATAIKMSGTRIEFLAANGGSNPITWNTILDIDNGGDIILGNASTNTISCTGRLVVRSVTDAGPMTNTAGTFGEIVVNTSDNKFYGCTVTGTPATWSALN